ncbi:ATP-binding protein [Aquabacterium sp. A7-Y]|uniref:hybrid sensor histidine kinase/response regulator n=1 Tax=Aquabacterium sp. A7-Y TaxID=1349605 RepID=UPI00223D0A6E|nr:ATP-binding protein [Aquabacterium sp. A7-Y]MCW7536307.1 ATP-binding protein [Aquabacterium sp. A7-Y]
MFEAKQWRRWLPQPRTADTRRWRRVIQWPASSLRVYFVIVILVATVPLAVFVSYLIYQETLTGRTQMEDGLKRTADTFALAVEREIVSSVDALSILAYSESLQRNDIAGFYRTLTQQPTLRATWSSAYLVAPNGDMLFSTDRPLGDTLGNVEGSPEFERLKSTRQPVVTDLVLGHDSDQLVTAVQVPVVSDGVLRYVLGARITASNWQALMHNASVPKGGFLSLFDANSRIIAHSLHPDQLVGADLNDSQPIAGDPGGLQKAPFVGASAAYAAWQRVAIAGWGVGVGIAAAPLNRAQLSAVASAVGAGALSLSLGLILALIVARQVTDPLLQLANEGPASARGKIVVREIAVLRDALVSAAEQREVARQRLQAKADEFEALFTSSPIGLAIAQDAGCRAVLMNAALAAMFNTRAGRNELPLPGQPPAPGAPHVFRHGRELPVNELPIQRACTEGVELSDVELDVVHPDGHTVNVLAYAVPLRNARGLPRGAIGAFVDITERKHAEERLISAERKLRESQNLVELAQEAGHVGFFDYHFAEDAVVWTSGLAKLCGVSPEALESSWEGWSRLLASEDVHVVREAVDDAVARRAEQTTFEFRVQRPDGSLRWLASRVLLSYDEQGRAARMIGVSVDVTDQKTVEQERAAFVAREQVARRDAESANRAKDEFLAMLGHELRNPLGAIAAAVEVLNRVGAQNDTAQSARRIIGRQTHHLARLMNDLLDMARATAGKITLSRQCLNFAQLVQRPIGALEVSGSLKQHTLDVELEDVWVEVDSMRIEQVVTNLLTNAVKYTPGGGRIEVRVQVDGEDAVLVVRDSGMGMPATLLPRVFDLFVQGERALDRRQGGLGIGLTLVRRIVELHGGTVEAESPGPNLGSCFTVRLKRATPPAAVVALSASMNAGAREVVVVEDNEDARNAIENLLTLAGHRVTVAEDGETGLQKVMDCQPDLALVDIGLPGLNGYEVAQRLRAAGRSTRLVALSGYGQPQDVERALAAGFDAHLVKPIDLGELQRFLAES